MPAANPSSLTTYGAPNLSSADSISLCSVQVKDPAVKTPASAITVFANVFEPSNCAAASDGPKQAIPTPRTASAAPVTNGPSGPITTKSTSRVLASVATDNGLLISSG